ncbi:uncharacterized protein LAESUDRAFT_760337 [Laetiporus sulphureus 93-53]|uniref:Uncharacterized protein n=1 Tax=Laetiporus sulphureus 93-53 TaxID=1314785 RepID=A0A165DRE9_9APHY|nr:uncharacterized protein LAESUDRAFT_760337 [Laetiporus sulphureus 93-53]KZT05469.1 hypothetical protein LAESUDRAFT_760337 [Laetiporus sulphureus 93-53]
MDAKEDVDSLKHALARSQRETAAEKRRADEYLKQARDQQERLALNEKNAKEQEENYKVELARVMRETQREKLRAERCFKFARDKQTLAKELQDALDQEKERRKHHEEEARQLQRERDALKKEASTLSIRAQ